mgnify:CR=1 FL=1
MDVVVKIIMVVRGVAGKREKHYWSEYCDCTVVWQGHNYEKDKISDGCHRFHLTNSLVVLRLDGVRLVCCFFGGEA